MTSIRSAEIHHPAGTAEHLIEWVQDMRAVACLMVVMLHLSTFFFLNPSPYSSVFITANLLDSLCRVAVPLFLMISGYLYMHVTTAKPKHVVRLLCALAFYSVPGIFLQRFYFHSDYRLLDIFTKPAFVHLWYFYTLIPVVALLCIIRPTINPRMRENKQALLDRDCGLLVFIHLSTASDAVGSDVRAQTPSGSHSRSALSYAFLSRARCSGRHNE